jgi:hypothetical protein
MTNQHQPNEKIQDRLDAAAADKAEAEARKAEADARQAAANAEKAETDAAASRYSALVPDTSKVKLGALDVKGTDATMASALAFAAVTDAAMLIANKIAEQFGDGVRSMRVIVTSNSDLIQGTATYLNLKRELEQLITQADALLEKIEKIKPPSQEAFALGGALAAGSALASAVPGVLSLFARHETLTRAAVKTDDLAAASAVSGALLEHAGKEAVITHDTFRIAEPGLIDHLAKELADKLPKLQQVTDPDTKKEATALIKAITTALGELIAVPKDGTRSPLSIASMYEAVIGANPKISHVLLVKGQPGSATELVDRRFIADDKVLIAATMGITYMLIDAHSRILAAGTETATVEAHGSIKEAIQLDSTTVQHLAHVVTARPLRPKDFDTLAPQAARR